MAKLIKGFNDLATTNPELAKEWHPTKNGDLKPTDVFAGSGLKVWWLLSYDDPSSGKHFDFEWEATILSRKRGNGCPFLSNYQILQGFNDLATTHPDLAKEWHPTKNGNLKPTDVIAGHNKIVWWYLPYDTEDGRHFDFEWEAAISNRATKNGCPFLSNHRVWVGFNDLATTHPDLAKEWHPTKNGDLKPTDIFAGSNLKVWWYLPYDTEDGKHFDFEWEASVSHRTDGRGCPYLTGTSIWVGFNDLSTANPELAKEWHPTKNGNLKPTDVTAGSNLKVWWYLPYDTEDGRHFDFEWEATISSRNSGIGCSFLSGKALWTGFNDLATVKPELVKEWHPTKNGDLKPTDVTAYTIQKVWWYLPYDTEDGRHFDFEWEAAVASRSKGRGCPYITNPQKAVWTGFNDLATVKPELVKEWHPIKNGDLKPDMVLARSHQKVWWYLPYDTEDGRHFDFEWEAEIKSRYYGSGCPFLPNCTNPLVWVGFNDLATTHPDLAKEWHPTKNGNLKPTDVTAGSVKKVWWYLPYDTEDGRHFDFEWRTTVNNRTIGKNGCPFLSGSAVWVGFNDLTTTHPDLAKEWHPTKNGDLKPTDVTAGSNLKVWWYLPYDTEDGRHFDFEWEANIASRSNTLLGCPFLSNHQVWVNYNDLMTVNPELAKEWHPTKNGNLKPTDVTVGSQKKVWWLCSNGHDYQTYICSRSKVRGIGCPICAESYLEKNVRKILSKYNYSFNEQMKFENLLGTGKGKLSYDFAIYNNNKLYALIECQGIQHFQPGEFFGGEKQYLNQIEHDKRKREFCEKNHILLIEIPYDFTEEDIEALFRPDEVIE